MFLAEAMTQCMNYNDMEFLIGKTNRGWNIARKLPNGERAEIAAALFSNHPDDNAIVLAQVLVRTIFPVGIRLVGPDVAHPGWIGELKIIGPDVSHPNFVYWNKDSSSFSK